MERTETQRKILEVGKKEFLEKGFKDASLNKIVAEAGFTKGAFYGYYPDKTALFEDLVGETASELLTRFKAAQDDYFDLIPEGRAKDSLELSTQHLHELVAFMYDHFDEFKLILCRAEGTGYADFIEVLVELEVDRSEEYYALLRKNGMLSGSMTRQLHHMITRAYFTAVCETIVHDMPREEAMKYVDELAIFFHSGWYALATVLLSAAIYFAGLMCTHLAAFRVATNIRKAAVTHLIDLPLGYFNANLTGRLRKQIDDNAALTETLLAHTIPDAVGGIVTPILAVVLLFVFDWRMGLACLIPMIIGLVCLMSMMTGTGMKFFEEYQRAGERISAEATEYVRGIPVVKIFQQTVYSFKSFHAAILSYRDLASGYAMMCRMPYTLLTVVLNAMFLLLMPLGMVLIGGAADGWAVLADLVFYIFFAPQLAFMMERLMYAVNAQMEAAEAVNKLEAILKESPFPEPAADSGSKPADSSISFENVTFSYDGADRPALTNVSFHLPQGEAWALVGPSGGGKSTAAKLAARFWDPAEGTVRLGGVDVSTVDGEALLENYAIVFQDVVLFADTVMENIRLGKRDATDAEVLAAAKAAQCDAFVSKLPEGYHTLIGENGSRLSGGERQRISIARAILKDAPVILLDEATASLDVENETAVQAALSGLIRDKTVLIIAHRMRTVMNADQIVLLSGGRVVEMGSPAELLKKNGLFRHMAQLQSESMEWTA